MKPGRVKPSLSLLCLAISAAVAWGAAELPQVDGTTGAPLGGFGTGAVKFCGNSGKFFFVDVQPAMCANSQKSYVTLPASFGFYSNRGGTVAANAKLVAVSANGRYDDDAIYPIQKVNFGTSNGVTVTMTGSCPWAPADTNRFTYPCAMFEFVLTNTQSTPVDAAIEFKLTTGSTPVLVAGKGFKDETNSHQKAVYAKSDDPAAVISVGGDADFATTGQCSNGISGATNAVAVKVGCAANATKRVKFVLAWYNAATPADYGYTNLFSAVGAVADSGLSSFDLFMNNAVSFVTRMRASNLPDWLVNTTLNRLCNITNNSKLTKDKRIQFAEGYWTNLGTQDHMWLARQANSQLCPFFAWKELEFWARTQKADATGLGQIHHDLGNCTKVATWTQTDWPDYRNINDWPDLNCGFIVNVYETYMATADRAKLDFFWPYVQKAGQRIITQLSLYGNKSYPCTFDSTAHSSYDWNGSGATHLYNSSLLIPTCKVMANLATIEGDAATAAQFLRVRDTAVVNFKKRFIDNIFTTAHYCEAISVGPWLCDFLKVGQDLDTASVNKLLDQLNTFYTPFTTGCGKNEGPDWGGNYYIWACFLLVHYGDLALVAGRPDVWYAMRHDEFLRTYQNRNRVFNISLPIYLTPTPIDSVAKDSSGFACYITNPSILRDYYTIIGYQRNRASGELWLEPNLPASMNGSLQNAYYASPEGGGTIGYTLNQTNAEQRLVFKPDSTIAINQIYVKDLYRDSVPQVWVNHVPVAKSNVSRIGMGYGRELKINWSGSAGPSGLSVEVASQTATLPSEAGKLLSSSVARSGRQLLIRYSLGHAAPVSIRVFRLNGGKLAEIHQGAQAAGMHELRWSGNRTAPSASLIVEIQAGEVKRVHKVLLLKS